ncbi:MAG TPA: FAD:protein FMN transferase [Candidatus Alistipes merdigallinarum]|nr:FAD:protein FMN transferase [Candidatus Alistipes merdigallinarum]
MLQHRISRNILLITTAAFFYCCSGKSDPKENRTVIDGFAQGGTYHIVLKGSGYDRESLKYEIDSLFAVVDNSMSLYNPESLLSRLNRNETDSVDLFITRCIEQAEQISRESDGAYDVTIKPLTAAYGFAEDSTSEAPNVDSLLQLVGYEKIAIRDGRLTKQNSNMQIDLNSLAQGATVDFIASWLDTKGFENYIIEMGGEIFCRGTNPNDTPWHVGIDRPIEGNLTPGVDLQVIIEVSGQGVATSGNYRKYYTTDDGRKIVHTLDARTGTPVISNLLSASVVASTATLADAYGTLFMILGLDRSKEFLSTHPDLQAYLVYSDDTGNLKTYVTPGLAAMIVSQPKH